ncbi:MAG: bifunctional demethylmenaquinone methyltransferase/2-methoxy-6-polyprenyl-1,4-benzoquinol methylase UbiE [Candidatus Omnitrophota bacterium]|nr:bifunctional demethylmenaquinone methyltransferase/2-methoxy-6-polyprenyl-1,4-benzoquinol methylase UbiE [Candidatus Omnitrophota bacterium]
MISAQQTNLPYAKAESWKMFNAISPRYDFLNHLLSFGLDTKWRDQLAAFLPGKEHLDVLDIATGTADVLLSLAKNNSRVTFGTGVDMAEKMLDIGRKKIHEQKLDNRIKLQAADANLLPFGDYSFDVATIAFGIRNVEYPTRVLREMHRVLHRGGRALILEFSLPKNPLVRFGHLFYLRVFVPIIGFLVSGHYRAYKYLNQTIESFPSGQVFCNLMKEAGFQNVKANPLLLGVASIYQGDKP